MKVVLCTPSLFPLPQPIIKSLAASAALLNAAGWEDGLGTEFKNPYISNARANLTRRALDAKADVIVYLDYDLSWNPEDLLTLIETPGDVVAGTYRFKQDLEEYMGVITTSDDNHKPMGRKDGCIAAKWAPAGFLKVTKEAVDRFMGAFPGLCYGPRYNPSVDLFSHGAFENRWWGEDAAFCRNWRAIGGEVWIVPDLDISHWDGDKEYPGNFHEFLMRQPGGSKHEKAIIPELVAVGV